MPRGQPGSSPPVPRPSAPAKRPAAGDVVCRTVSVAARWARRLPEVPRPTRSAQGSDEGKIRPPASVQAQCCPPAGPVSAHPRSLPPVWRNECHWPPAGCRAPGGRRIRPLNPGRCMLPAQACHPPKDPAAIRLLGRVVVCGFMAFGLNYRLQQMASPRPPVTVCPLADVTAVPELAPCEGRGYVPILGRSQLGRRQRLSARATPPLAVELASR